MAFDSKGMPGDCDWFTCVRGVDVDRRPICGSKRSSASREGRLPTPLDVEVFDKPVQINQNA